MVNKVQLLGRVGGQPEVRHLDNGNAVANFTLATNENWKDKDGVKHEETEWHRLVVWGKRAEVVEKYVDKGKLLYIDGKIKTRKWTDKENNERYTTEIVVNDFQFVGSKADNNEQSTGTTSAPKIDNIPAGEDDLPF